MVNVMKQCLHYHNLLHVASVCLSQRLMSGVTEGFGMQSLKYISDDALILYS